VTSPPRSEPSNLSPQTTGSGGAPLAGSGGRSPRTASGERTPTSRPTASGAPPDRSRLPEEPRRDLGQHTTPPRAPPKGNTPPPVPHPQGPRPPPPPPTLRPMDPLPRPCSTPRCPRPATNRGRCAPCASVAEADRNTDRNWRHRFYASPEWLRARRAHLTANPWCTWIEADGRPCLEAAVDVDHEPELVDYDPDPLDPHRLRGLCHPHHSAKTATRHGFGGTGRAD